MLALLLSLPMLNSTKFKVRSINMQNVIDEISRLKYVYNNIKRRVKKHNESYKLISIEFIDFLDFQYWYQNKKTELNNKCDYCKTDQNKITELFEWGNKTEGKIGLFSKRSKNRGKNLEVDRKNPHGNYSKENCTLICYFCNNDKSDILDETQYMNYFASYKINNKTLRQIYIDEMFIKLQNSKGDYK